MLISDNYHIIKRSETSRGETTQRDRSGLLSQTMGNSKSLGMPFILIYRTNRDKMSLFFLNVYRIFRESAHRSNDWKWK